MGMIEDTSTLSTVQDRFKRDFDAYITESREYKQHNYQPYNWSVDGSASSAFARKFDIEPMVAIHLPNRRFASLMEQQVKIDRLEADAKHNGHIWRTQLKEQQIRAATPAVQLAYDHYKMLLELARK
jgi:hypothetical protein